MISFDDFELQNYDIMLNLFQYLLRKGLRLVINKIHQSPVEIFSKMLV